MKRRDFAKITGLGALALHAFPATASLVNQEKAPSLNNPLGVSNHALRGMKPNAMDLIEYAIGHQLEAVQFNTLAPFESLEDKHLSQVKKLADRHDIRIYVGVGSICEQSVKFTDRYGNADALVKEGMRVAKALGSPIVAVRIGQLDDRYTEGGIKPKMEEVVKRMRSMRSPMLDAGMKFAFENHAGDMRSEELLDMIDATGSDICGAFFDPGNATYAMEDPIVAMKAVGKHILCSQARDVVIWPSEEGATFQWTAVGEGMMDFKFYSNFLNENCPGVPIIIETISNSPRSIPYLTNDYWKGWPDLRASDIIDFLTMVRSGKPIDVAVPPTGMDKRAFEIDDQKNELRKSIKYLREECGVQL
jgi:sugar phosphate isomerase/epimerase